jgi:purine nucleosidase
LLEFKRDIKSHYDFDLKIKRILSAIFRIILVRDLIDNFNEEYFMKKVWVDTDPGVDDIFALAMLFEAQDKIEILGLSTIFGNTTVDKTTRNAKLILEAVGKEHLPVARGASYPLYVPLDTSPFVHGDNGLGNMKLGEPTMDESPLSAPQAIIDVILANPHEVTLLPIGPLTNIAMAYLLEPKIAELVKEVVIMGGAVRCPGNITPTAEANFFHDPHAAQIVIRAGWPISLAGLDVCTYGMIPEDLLDEICSADKPLTPYIASAVPFFKNFLESYGFSHAEVDFPDALAAAYLLDPQMFETEEVHLFVEATGSCQGQSIEVPHGKWYENLEDSRTFEADNSIAPVNVMFKVKTQKFLDLAARLLI